MDCVISEAYYKGTWEILLKNNRKMNIPWSFSYNSFVKFHYENIGSHNMIVLYLKPCYKEECYKGTALWSRVVYKQREKFPILEIGSCSQNAEKNLLSSAHTCKILRTLSWQANTGVISGTILLGRQMMSLTSSPHRKKFVSLQSL